MAYLMIIDDDEDYASSIALVLSNAGHEVTIMRDTDSAKLSMNERCPDIAILDVMFPGNDIGGFELAQTKNHSNKKLNHIPIVMLSSVNTHFPMGFSLKDIDNNWMPVEAFFEKPVDPDILINKISQILSDKK
jgi:DNA-binding response OmpR family regulator